MTEFSFYLSDADTQRLFELKTRQGLDDLTGNEFAWQLLEDAIYRYCDTAEKTPAGRGGLES